MNPQQGQVDYDALAKQYGATSSVDYDALAKQYGATSSTPPTQAKPQSTNAVMSNAPTGVLPWLRNLEGDVRYGTGTTAPGRVLQKMGAQGTDVGAQAGTQEGALASPVLGPIRVAEGVSEANRLPWQATKDIVGGALQTASLPAAFMAPKVADAATDLIPSAKYAGKLFEQAKAAAGDLPVDVSGAGDAALRAQELAENGGRMPTLLNKFIRKSTTPGAPDIDYNTARDFYSNSGQQSIWQKLSTSPQMQRQIAQFRSSLGDAIQKTADDAGVGDVYKQALQEYHRAMVAKGLGKWALTAAAIKAAHDFLGSDITGAIKGAAGAVIP